MRILLTLIACGLVLAGTANAFDNACGVGCGTAGCDSCQSQICTPTVKTADIKKTCFNIECKTVCIPPTRFPWDPSPCDTACGNGCGCGTVACGTTGCGTVCGTAGCGVGGTVKPARFSRLRAFLGMSNHGVCRVVKVPRRSNRKCGETCVCEWKCENGGCGAGGTPASDPSYEAPVDPETKPPTPPPAPPINAGAPRRIRVR